MAKMGKRRRKKSSAPLFVLLLVLATLIPIGLSFKINQDAENCLTMYEGEHLDERAEKIKTHFWQKSKRNKEGDFSYEIKKEPLFEGPEQTCEILLANPSCNSLLMYAELSYKDSGRVFFRSGLLRPGEMIKNITPDEKLPLGEFEAVASICAVDPESEEFTGFLTQELAVEVKE